MPPGEPQYLNNDNEGRPNDPVNILTHKILGALREGLEKDATGEFINDTANHAGPFSQLYVVSDAVFSGATFSQFTNNLNGVTIPAGTFITGGSGTITNVQLGSGIVQAFD